MYYLNCFYVAMGGAIGALSRYLISTWVYNKFPSDFPFGTFIVNILGCFLLGAFYTITLERSVMSPHIRIMINVGLLGALTTFSTFSLETMNIIKEENITIALLNIGVNVLVGLIAVWLGTSVSNFFLNYKKGV